MLKQSGNAIVWSYDGETLRAEPWGDASVRVRAVKMGKIGQAPDWALLPSENTEIDITETEYEGLKALCLKNGKISVIVQENGRVTILDRNGKKLLQEFVRDRTVRGTDFSALMISAREFMPNPGGGYALKVLGPADFAGLYRPEWSNALCEKRRELDVLAVGAYDGARLVGLAGCSADCESMWQIGVDVLPGYRRRGVAAALTSRLAAETLARGKVPFYCAAWSNIKSVRNAVKCGFVPAWAELTAKPEAFVRELNGQ